MQSQDDEGQERQSRESDRSELLERIAQLEEAVDRLTAQQLYSSPHATGAEHAVLPAGQERFVKATADGWLEVMVNGSRTPLPSGLAATLTNSAGGRDFATVKEGPLAGTAFDVTTGNLVANFRSVDNLELTVARRLGPPVVVGQARYDLEIRVRYDEAGVAKTAGPFAAMTQASNPYRRAATTSRLRTSPTSSASPTALTLRSGSGSTIPGTVTCMPGRCRSGA